MQLVCGTAQGCTVIPRNGIQCLPTATAPACPASQAQLGNDKPPMMANTLRLPSVPQDDSAVACEGPVASLLQ